MRVTDLPNDRHRRYFQAAYITAISSPGAGRDSFRHGCIIVYKKNILVAKHNLRKTHPALLKYTKYPYLHSETNAIISLGIDNCYNTMLYVIRIMKNNHIALSKPCQSCQKLIEKVGIKNVYYSTYEGYMRM